MKITFVVRLHKLNGGRLGFYVPKNIIEYYGVKPQAIEGHIKWWVWRGEISELHTEELPDIGTKLYTHHAGLRGVIPRWTNMPDAGTLVELSIAVA